MKYIEESYFWNLQNKLSGRINCTYFSMYFSSQIVNTSDSEWPVNESMETEENVFFPWRKTSIFHPPLGIARNLSTGRISFLPLYTLILVVNLIALPTLLFNLYENFLGMTLSKVGSLPRIFYSLSCYIIYKSSVIL